MGVHKYNYNWDFFEKDSEELYYFLGFVAADGYISNGEIEIGLNEKDLSLLQKFRDLIAPNKPIYHKKRTNSYTLKISCLNKINNFKKFYSMVSNKKHDEMLYPNIPDKYQKHFIRGYIDGDGTIGPTKSYQIVKGVKKTYIGLRLRILGNENFLKELNATTQQFCQHKTKAINKKKGENVYCITYNFKTADSILQWLYEDATIYLDRKYNKYIELKKS